MSVVSGKNQDFQRNHGQFLVVSYFRHPALARFGFNYFNHYGTENGCQIVAANQQSLSPEQEMVENSLTIVHCSSSQ
ncbi:hypothetical protein LAY57_01600 [Argonema antarcticum A004/B2]|nr:hypothetical protein [Argonema antarcticum]MCL1469364.1 hypothetical protein [Argonema antarcticum A004/B2]